MSCPVRAEAWEELGSGGLKMLLAIYEAGGEADLVTVAYAARIGRTAWYRLKEVLKKYGFAEEVDDGRKLRLTQKGQEAGAILMKFDELLQP